MNSNRPHLRSSQSPDTVSAPSETSADGLSQSQELGEVERLRARVRVLEQRLSGVEGHDLLAAVLETSVAAITVLDPVGNIVYANSRAEKILGLRVSEIERRSYRDPEWKATAVDGGPWPDESQPFTRVVTTGKPVEDVQHAIEWPDGQRKALSVSGAPIFDAEGRLSIVVFSIADVTERASTESALRASEAAFRSLIETIPSYILSVGKDRRIRFLNRDLPQHRLADVIGEPVSRFVTSEFRDEFEASITRVFETGEIQELETRADIRDQPATWFLSRMGPLRSERGIESVTIVGFDITDLKNAEIALQESEAQLQQAQRLESIGRLAGGVAHDFNNLLTVVTGCVDQLHRELSAEGSGLVDLTRDISFAADRGAQLTQQLLAFACRQVVQPRVVLLSDLVPVSSELVRRLIGEDIELEFQIADDVYPVRVDPGQFEQVLVNLAVNARDAMPSGGRLSLVASNVDVPTAARSPLAGEPCVRIVVEDTGCGLSTEAIQHAFDPFYTTKPAGQGTGLGLATCFGVVSQSGGTIAVENAEAGGARFVIDLPRAEFIPDARPLRESTRQVRSGAETILLVEDEPKVRQVSSSMLRDAGYHVLVAPDGPSALQQAESTSTPVDVLVTDVVMPGMSGPKLALTLLSKDPSLEVIFTSGYPADLNLELAQRNQQGVDLRSLLGDEMNFLQKPFSAGQLTSKIRDVVDRSIQKRRPAVEDPQS